MIKNNLKIGKIVTVIVTGIEKYGIFVKIDGEYTGLIHISEITDLYVENINDYVNIGDKINAYIVDIDNESKKLKLSIKKVKNYRFRNNQKKLEKEKYRFISLKKIIKKLEKEKIYEMEKNKKKD